MLALLSFATLTLASCGQTPDSATVGSVSKTDLNDDTEFDLPDKRPQSQFYDAGDLRQRITEKPGVPFVFPKDLRSNYQLMRLSGERIGGDGKTYARIYDFAPRPLSDKLPTANACAIRTDHTNPNARELCYGERPASQILERQVGEMTLVISFDMPPKSSDREYWSTTPLTTDLSEVSWLK